MYTLTLLAALLLSPSTASLGEQNCEYVEIGRMHSSYTLTYAASDVFNNTVKSNNGECCDEVSRIHFTVSGLGYGETVTVTESVNAGGAVLGTMSWHAPLAADAVDITLDVDLKCGEINPFIIKINGVKMGYLSIQCLDTCDF